MSDDYVTRERVPFGNGVCSDSDCPKNPKCKRNPLADAGMSNLLSQIQYKTSWYGTLIVEADQRYPSSKTCSGCGVVNRDLGREREWDCPNCGTQHDRNRNAARNLPKLALLAVGEDVTLPDGEALAGGDSLAGETAPDEGRTKPMTTAYTQPRLAL